MGPILATVKAAPCSLLAVSGTYGHPARGLEKVM